MKAWLRGWRQNEKFMEAFLYLVVGVLTTIVNFVVFTLCDRNLEGKGMNPGTSYKIAYVLAFILAVLFAYITNKIFVFKNFCFTLPYLAKECSLFFSARIISGMVSFLLMILFVDFWHFSHTLGWLLTTVVNLGFNYVASKFFIFKGE